MESLRKNHLTARRPLALLPIKSRRASASVMRCPSAVQRVKSVHGGKLNGLFQSDARETCSTGEGVNGSMFFSRVAQQSATVAWGEVGMISHVHVTNCVPLAV